MPTPPLAALAAVCLAIFTAQPDNQRDPPTTPAPLDLPALAERARAEADTPALALVRMPRDGEPTAAAAGVRVAGEPDIATTDDLWHLGSITKSMTATLAARLVENDIIAWDDTVADHLAGAVPNMLDTYKTATLTQLLANRAGLQPNIPIERFNDFHTPDGQPPEDPIADRLRWVTIALAQEPVAPPGERYTYSNNGYIVAGAMLEAATGEPWETLIRRELFDPLGLTSAGIGPPPGDAQPRGHTTRDGADTPAPPTADNPPALGPAGRVHMSLPDLARYLHAHATRDPDFLTADSYDRLHTPVGDGNYALGWVALTPTTRWHNGSNTMWYAEAVFNLETGHAAAVAVNDGDLPSVQPTVRATLAKLMQSME